MPDVNRTTKARGGLMDDWAKYFSVTAIACAIIGTWYVNDYKIEQNRVALAQVTGHSHKDLETKVEISLERQEQFLRDFGTFKDAEERKDAAMQRSLGRIEGALGVRPGSSHNGDTNGDAK